MGEAWEMLFSGLSLSEERKGWRMDGNGSAKRNNQHQVGLKWSVSVR
jgi:hypothetical protein